MVLLEEEAVEWSEQALSVWGKTCRDDDTWMPLVQHLDDAGAVAGMLWDEWLPSSVKQLVESSLPTGSDDGRTFVSWLAGVHDVGKCSPAFAVQANQVGMERLTDRMIETGLHMPHALADRAQVPHALAGQIALRDWLVEERGSLGRNAQTIADVVGCHHGRAPNAARVEAARNRPQLLGSDAWSDVRREVLAQMAIRTGAEQHLQPWLARPLPVPVRMLTTAIVVLSDWLASDADRFAYVGTPVDGRARAEEAWDSFRLARPLRTRPSAEVAGAVLADRFPRLAGHEPRPVQTLCYDVARAATGPTLMIVEAPMGHGKTEAALLAAEQLAARDGSGGIFFALPTMATSDAMFGRVRDFVEMLPDQQAISIFLAHGKAALNDEYAGMVDDARVAEVYDDGSDVLSDAAEAVAVSWLSGRRKGVLADVVVGTIDQVLYLALNSKFLPLRHLALAGKVVVIDEVHAADEYMLTFLRRTIEWLAAYGVSVVLLSATLPSARRAELVARYRFGLGLNADSREEPVGYPAVTAVSGAGTTTTLVDADGPTSRVAVTCIDDDLETLARQVADLVVDGGCIAVIRDTVARAQETADHLRATYGADVVLVHSRFLANERAQREAKLRAQLGPDSSERPSRLIVVGTQVLEQSLDVDFDAMITDIAPVDLVLQRVGRLHRHRRPVEQRPPVLREPRLLITGISEWDGGIPTFDRGVRAVYHEARLLRAAALLASTPDGCVSLDLPGDIRSFVERAYAVVPAVPDDWRPRVAEADTTLATHLVERAQKAEPFVLAEVPSRGDVSLMALGGLGPDDPEKRSGGSVRDGEDGLEVIVVQQLGREVRMMPGEFPYAGSTLTTFVGWPEPAQARALATCTVRLPMQMTTPWAVDNVLDALERLSFDNWQQSPWLSGQLVLRLDEEFRSRVGGFDLQYDRESGLRMVRTEGRG